MLQKLRNRYKQNFAVRITTVILVVLLAMGIMLPIVEFAKLLGVDLRKNNNLNLEVDLANIFVFLLFVACSTSIIWLAQKYIHKAKLFDLGFRTKVFKFLIIGFLAGAIKSGAGYLIMGMNAGILDITRVVPEADVSTITYIGYYLYFIVGFMFLNSFIEELVTRAYPIERLRKHINPHIIFIIMGIIFTAGHFFVREFDLGYCMSLFIYSYTFSLLYHYSNSIWLVIGMHTGVNWLGFSFFGTNWKLGALYTVEMSNVPEWIASYTQPIVGLIVLLIIVLLKKKGFFQKFSA